MASTYLSRTLGTSTNTYKGTVSVWFKKSQVSSDQVIYGNYTSGTQRGKLVVAGDGKLMYYQNDAGSVTIQLETTRLFRDFSAFYHVVLSVDTTQASSSDRVKLYVNGVQETAFDTATYPSQNTVFYLNADSVTNYIGQEGNSSDYWDGSMSYFSVVDGTAYDASYFGETDSSSGIWKIKTGPSVTYGTNGFFLKMDTSSPGTDTSGNNNTFTASGTPTLTQDNASNNFAVFNPIANGGTNLTITNCNTTVYDSDSTWRSGFGGLAPSSGKWYFEAKRVGSSSNAWVGIMDSSQLDGTGTYKLTAKSRGYGYSASGEKGNSGSESAWGNTYTQNDIIGVAMDLDNQKIYFSKNGTWENSGVPTSGSTGTGSMYDLASGYNYYPATSLYSTSAGFSFNFGNGFFGETAVTSSNADAAGHGLMEYAVPSGYYTLNTKNLNTYG